MALDLDVYIAARTAPKQGYHNPVKGVISTQNLGLQNVATARVFMEPAKETRMKSLETLKKINEAVKRDPSIRDNLEDSIKPVLDLMSNHFSQLRCSGNPLKIE